MKTAEENKTCQSIETRIKIENTEEQLEDAEEHINQPITSQEDIKEEITEENTSRQINKEEFTEENTSRQINKVENAEEQNEEANRSKIDEQPIREEIGEKAEENAEKRNKLINQSEEDYIEDQIIEMEREISEKLSDIKKEEVGEPFDKKDVSFIHIKRVRTYLRSGDEDSSDDPGKQDDLKHKNKRLKSNSEDKEDTYQRSENEAEDYKEDSENDDSYEKWKKLKDYYKDSSDESDEEEEYNRWKRRKKQVMEIIRRNENYRAEKCRGEGAVEHENSKPANVANPATKVKSLLAERFHLASCSQLTDSETENEEEDNNSENKDTEDRNDQPESTDKIMLSESSMSEGEEREIANCFNQIQEIINRRFNGENVNNDSQQRENANQQPEDNSSDGHSRNDENNDNQPEENENLNGKEERTIESSRGSTRSYNSELEEELFLDMQDPTEINYSDQERINIMSYNVKFRSNPGHWICEPINGELEVAVSDDYEEALTHVRDTLRGERHNGRYVRAAVVDGHSTDDNRFTHRYTCDDSETKFNGRNNNNHSMEKERRRMERWEEDLQKRIEEHSNQRRMLKVREDRLTFMEKYARELSPINLNVEEYNREEKEAQNRSIEVIKKCEAARGKNIFDVADHQVRDENGKAIAEIKTIFIVRDLKPHDDKREYTYRINATISRGTAEVKIQAHEKTLTSTRAITSASTATTASEESQPKIIVLPQQTEVQQQQQQIQQPQYIILPSGDVGMLRKIAPKPTTDSHQPITAKHPIGADKRKRSGESERRDHKKKKSGTPIIKSIIKTKSPQKPKTRKTAEKAKKRIKRCTEEDDKSSEEDEISQYLPTRTDEIKTSVLKKIFITEVPRRMKSLGEPATSSSGSGRNAPVIAQPTEDYPEDEPNQGMSGTPRPASVAANEEVKDASFESVEIGEILQRIPVKVAQVIAESEAKQPAGQRAVPEDDDEPPIQQSQAEGRQDESGPRASQ
ncbi:myb-like protein X [Temnothorax curvispinosus]|uniref:Myb-like protein X n=1 Tax=Temnothorax curvispinosus TaxID=300111 RepID=A0A6J1R8Z4_9HYME|nr:myb-like protein X [Temnothorax curvispinosus]